MPLRRVEEAPTDSVPLRARETDEVDERAVAEVLVRAREGVLC
jgi:hypothetical protein